MIESGVLNWARNEKVANSLVEIESIEHLKNVVRSSKQVRAVGSRHSFSGVSGGVGAVVDFSRLAGSIDLDHDRSLVRVSAGTTYSQLSRSISASGFALPNLGSLPHITVAGACATGTHGSGDRNGVLATSVQAVELITENGNALTIRKGDTLFDAVPVSLGLLGVVTSLELSLVRWFSLAQNVYEGLERQTLVEEVLDILAFGYSVSIFMRWGREETGRIWVKSPSAAAETAPFGTRPASETDLSPLGHRDTNMTAQGGVDGPWHERLPHFRADHVPSSGDELQSEYFVPRAHASAALRNIASLDSSVFTPLLVSEVRSVRSDALWLSPAHGVDSVSIHFTWINDAARVRAVLPAIEEALTEHGARPHWGKIHTFGRRVAGLYPRWEDFISLRNAMDPRGKFLSPYLSSLGFDR